MARLSQICLSIGKTKTRWKVEQQFWKIWKKIQKSTRKFKKGFKQADKVKCLTRTWAKLQLSRLKESRVWNIGIFTKTRLLDYLNLITVHCQPRRLCIMAQVSPCPQWSMIVKKVLTWDGANPATGASVSISQMIVPTATNIASLYRQPTTPFRCFKLRLLSGNRPSNFKLIKHLRCLLWIQRRTSDLTVSEETRAMLFTQTRRLIPSTLSRTKWFLESFFYFND